MGRVIITLIFYLLVYIINPCNGTFINKSFRYLVPFYDFELHTTPMIFTNNTDMIEEMKFYDNMKRSTILHVAGSTIASVAISTTFFYLSPIPISYWAYHIYIFQKSSHMEQKCKFIIDVDENEEERFLTTNKWYFYNIPEFFFNPILFCLFVYIFLFVIILKYGLSKKIIFSLILFFYTYSFFQQVKDSINRLTIKREIKLRELQWKCNSLRMSYWRRAQKSFLSFWGFQTDKYGYLVDDKDCQQLEIELYSIDESFIDILYKTFTKSFLLIFKELYYSISLIDRVLIVTFSLLFYKIIKSLDNMNFLNKKKYNIETQQEEEGEEIINKNDGKNDDINIL